MVDYRVDPLVDGIARPGASRRRGVNGRPLRPKDKLMGVPERQHRIQNGVPAIVAVLAGNRTAQQEPR